jgi:C1A family cysteine protease
MPINRVYGWRPGLPRPKAAQYMPLVAGTVLPSKVDLRSRCPAPYDQSQLGSCTANATGALAHFLMKKFGKGDWVPSRLALYYWTRTAEKTPTDDTVAEDAGASLHDAIHTLTRWGVPHESLWPYDIRKFKVNPPAAVSRDAYAHQLTTPLAVPQTTLATKSLLASGYPFVLGFTVYPGFETDAAAKTGVVPMPGNDEQPLGGHAVMVVGYDDRTERFLVRNSWGRDWGMGGYFTMPYSYLLSPDLASDFWTARAFAKFAPGV